MKQNDSSIWIDFVKGPMGYRRKHGGGYQQALAKAVGIKPSKQGLKVLDCTAGLGKDGFILACLGCQVSLIEKSTIITALLQDGFMRAKKDPELAKIIEERISVYNGDSLTLLQNILDEARESEGPHGTDALNEGRGTPESPESPESSDSVEFQKFKGFLGTLRLEKPDVIYLDPMFPEKNKKALSNLDLRILRDIVGPDTDSDRLLPLALKVAKQRVVVKRPLKAPKLSSLTPSYSLLGKSNRYDVYIVNT